MIIEPTPNDDVTDPSVDALIASRICHDLINPIGAIGNGLELLTLSGKGAGPELDLIGESVARAQARIRFFRIAFGEFDAARRINPVEVRSILNALFAGTRISMDWQIASDLPRREAKLCFLLLLCMETALPRGGIVTASEGGDGWTLIAQAERLHVDPTVWNGLSCGQINVELTPTLVPFALAARHSQMIGARITVDTCSDSIAIAFSLA